jgi:hypothetical protein
VGREENGLVWFGFFGMICRGCLFSLLLVVVVRSFVRGANSYEPEQASGSSV